MIFMTYWLFLMFIAYMYGDCRFVYPEYGVKCYFDICAGH